MHVKQRLTEEVRLGSIVRIGKVIVVLGSFNSGVSIVSAGVREEGGEGDNDKVRKQRSRGGGTDEETPSKASGTYLCDAIALTFINKFHRFGGVKVGIVEVEFVS